MGPLYLVANSVLDEQLLEILRAFMVNSKITDELLSGHNAPLGQSAARAWAAFALGLITESEYDQLKTIRAIRNEFGHKWKDTAFSNQKIGDLCKNLPDSVVPREAAPEKPKDRFDSAVRVLLLEFSVRPGEVRKLKRVVGTWPASIRYVSAVKLSGKGTELID